MSVTRRGLRLPARKWEDMSVKAGVLENATYPAETITDATTGKSRPDPRAGMHVATIAAALEYGAGQNHPRPFMQQTYAQQNKAWAKAVVTLIVQGQNVDAALLTVGQVMKEDIQMTINDWPADNSPRWAETKGFSHGLIFTGHLLRSIEAEIEK